jgi:hypothetical protein
MFFTAFSHHIVMWFENLTSTRLVGVLLPLLPCNINQSWTVAELNGCSPRLFNSCRLAHRAALPVRLPLRIPALRIVFYHETFVLSPLARFPTLGQ